MHNFIRLFDRKHHAVTAIAIFTVEDGKTMPDRYLYSFMGTELIYKYNTLYITDHADEDLEQSDNPFALALLAAKKALFTGKVDDLTLLEIKLSYL
ncbi:MAG TPA: hypothetical protein VGN00_02565 [Puia sp.]